MIRLFVDTGAWYALTDPKDPGHQRSADCLEGQTAQLVKTNFVFDMERRKSKSVIAIDDDFGIFDFNFLP